MSNPFDPKINPEQVFPFWGFVVFDSNSKLPLYSQYTFDFVLYATDFNLFKKSKNEIFYDFWIRNQCNFEKPYTVLPELQKYFFPMPIEVVNYINTYSFAAHYGRLTNTIPKDATPDTVLVEEQFDLKLYTPIELSRVEDYFYEETLKSVGIINEEIYSKYNFNFEQYSTDYNIYGPKRLIFTQFLTRNQFLSGVIVNSQTYGIADIFKKYFDQSGYNELVNYLIISGCGSSFPNTLKNFYNINWPAYILDNNLQLTIPEAKEQWYQEGQFDRLIVKFFPPPTNELDIVKNSVGILYNGQVIGSFFRIYYPDENVYVLTALHTIPDPDSLLFLGTFELTDPNGIRTTITAQFRIIGKDSIYDMAVGKFDPTLPFNITNGVTTLNFIPPISIDVNKRVEKNDNVYMFGTIGPIGVLTSTVGLVVDPNYTGPMDYNFDDAKYILSQITSSLGQSGGPQFIKDPDTKVFSCVSMTVQNIGGVPTLCVALTADILYDFVNSAILRWNKIVALFGINSTRIANLIELGSNKSWLGITGNYYDKSLFEIYTKLSNLNYTGGFVISKIIEGIDFDKKEFIFNTFELNSYSTIQLYSPLSNTTIQRRLNTTNAPVVIKDLAYFDSSSGNYIQYKIGKYEGQDSLYKFSIGFQSIGDFLNPTYYDGVKEIFPRLKIDYFYYNGNQWEEETEYIGSVGPEWFVTYKNLSGDIETVNKFRLPPFLVIYVSSIYSILYTGEDTNLFNQNFSFEQRNYLQTNNPFNIGDKLGQAPRRPNTTAYTADKLGQAPRRPNMTAYTADKLGQAPRGPIKSNVIFVPVIQETVNKNVSYNTNDGMINIENFNNSIFRPLAQSIRIPTK
jgi:hypothetical protein